MNNTQHTDGPWGWYDASGPLKGEVDQSIVASRLADLSPSPVTIVIGTRNGEVRVSNEANALLIAASPLLLEVLQAALKGRRHDDNCALDKRPSRPCDCTIAKGQAAIARATGKGSP